MDSNTTLSPETASSSDSRSRRAACLTCRRSKIKCSRSPDEIRCERCRQTDSECVVPEYHVGRQKGVKNKRKGLDKALYQIQEAIKKSRSVGPESQAGRSVSDLQSLLKDAQALLSQSRESVVPEDRTLRDQLEPSAQQAAEDHLGIADAENPLQMLARASDLQLSQLTLTNENSSLSPMSRSSVGGRTEKQDQPDVHWFFVPIRANPDFRQKDVDPIDMGLATLEEAKQLFAFFYKNLAHTRWGFDPVIHSFDFVRTQSTFLFTSILAASALFIPTAEALSKRLSTHRTLLARRVLTERHRSVEIVLALMVNVPWMPPGEHSADDESPLYLSMALTIALDLSLNKIVLPTSNFTSDLFKRLARADCIDGKKALHMDGFDDIQPTSSWGRRLLRRRERAWIALFVLERGFGLARGRSFTVPITPILETCDNWHVSEIADSRDGAMTSMAVLRRDLDDLFRTVKSSCDGYQVLEPGSDVAQTIKTTIEDFYDHWFAAWAFTIGEGEHRTLPPYVEILVTHTRLSTYAGVINHPTAPIEVKRFFRAATLSSALNVLRAAIQGEKRLKSMPNNTAIMISFAACFALNLSGAKTGDSVSQLAPSVKNLIVETANVLERIGGSPPHRNGASALYGRYLRELIKSAPEDSAISQKPQSQPGPVVSSVEEPTNIPEQATPSFIQDYRPPVHHHYQHMSPTQTSSMVPQPPPPNPSLWTEPLHFSTMSGNQIVEAINQAGTTWDMFPTQFNFDDMTGLDFFDWGNTQFGL